MNKGKMVGSENVNHLQDIRPVIKALSASSTITFKVSEMFSLQARDRKVLGDLNGAQVYASTARCLNIWSTALVFCIILLSIIVTIITSVQASQAIRRYNNYQSG